MPPKKELQYTEQDLERMKYEWENMPVNDFIYKYKMSSHTAVRMFGRKFQKQTIHIRKHYAFSPEDIEFERNTKMKEIKDKHGLSSEIVERLLKDYTFTEILEGEFKEGKFYPKILIKVWK